MAKAKGQEISLNEYTVDQAQQILDDYFDKYQGVDGHVKATEQFVRKHGYALSVYGYKRRVPAGLDSSTGDRSPEQERAIRQAVNFTIQNPASVSLLLSLCDMQDEIDEQVESGQLLPDAILLIGSCHDAGYSQVDYKLILTARDMKLKHMCKPPIENCPIPITAEAEYGKSWDEFTEDFSDCLGALAEDVDEDEEDNEEAE